jgi:DNA-binding MarR family transcriptional regulator
LSDEGFALADELVVSHVETEERLLAALTDEERDRLRALLNKISAATFD